MLKLRDSGALDLDELRTWSAVCGFVVFGRHGPRKAWGAKERTILHAAYPTKQSNSANIFQYSV